jgi:hypothetical protein
LATPATVAGSRGDVGEQKVVPDKPPDHLDVTGVEAHPRRYLDGDLLTEGAVIALPALADVVQEGNYKQNVGAAHGPE